MLAYIFWHWPRPDVDAAVYERALRGFHRRLRQAPCPGLLATASFGVAGLPWAADAGPAYEDWHLLSSSAALDALNAAAVSGDCAPAHDEVARQAGGGTAGLYHLAHGVATLNDAICHWFNKPAGMAYADLLTSLDGRLGAGDCLWQRRMVLGPGPEFCLATPERRDPLPGLPYLPVARRRLGW